MNKYFGTDGFRGVAGVELTAERAFRIGRYLGRYLKENKETDRPRVVIGKDTRLSCYMLEYAIASGLAASGADVSLMHVTTTPCVTYITVRDSFDFGVMITASHNPFMDNGIKIIDSQGEKIDDNLASLIERYIDNNVLEDITYATGADVGRIIDYSLGREEYIEHLSSLATHSYSGLRIGIDTANGSATKIAREVFERLGATVYQIGEEPNGLNANDCCGSTHPKKLADVVKKNQLDLGFAFDGDADRCIAIDHDGNIVDGDRMLYLFTKRMLRQNTLGSGGVVTTVMSNGGLITSLAHLGVNVELTKVGDRFVYERMQELGANLGGEQSGHIILKKYATTGDGIITAIMILEEIMDTGCSLSELTKGLTVYPQISRSIRVKSKEAAISNPDLARLIARIKENNLPRGRLLVRASGTEPAIRIMAEDANEENCKKCIDEMIAFLINRGYADE